MTKDAFVIANVKQLRTQGVLEFYIPFLRIFPVVGDLISAIFNPYLVTWEVW